MWGADNFAIIEKRSSFPSQRPPALIPTDVSQEVGTEDCTVSLYLTLEIQLESISNNCHAADIELADSIWLC